MSKISHEDVQNYYGKELQGSEDLKTNACCTIQSYPDHIMQALRNVHDEVQAKYYGCGLTLPDYVEGMKILDLGSGSGRDVYIASQLVGANGSVVGIDMTDEQLALANEYKNYHSEKFGFSNVEFIKGNIDELDRLGLEKGSFDIIISNCVINLCMNKEKVLKDCFDLLKTGGEMFFSDVYCDRRIPKHLQEDKTLYGECLSGALYFNDFIDISKHVGFLDPREVDHAPITIQNPELEKKVDGYRFSSITYRLFKLEALELRCEDYGHKAVFKGSELSNVFTLDHSHHFSKNHEEKICGNTYKMLKESRFSNLFEFTGNFEEHLGEFKACGTSFQGPENSSKSSCC